MRASYLPGDCRRPTPAMPFLTLLPCGGLPIKPCHYAENEIICMVHGLELGSAGYAVVRSGFRRVTEMGHARAHVSRPLPIKGLLRRAASSLLPQLRRAGRCDRVALTAAALGAMHLWLRTPIQPLHVPRRPLVPVEPENGATAQRARCLP